LELGIKYVFKLNLINDTNLKICIFGQVVYTSTHYKFDINH